MSRGMHRQDVRPVSQSGTSGGKSTVSAGSVIRERDSSRRVETLPTADNWRRSSRLTAVHDRSLTPDSEQPADSCEMIFPFTIPPDSDATYMTPAPVHPDWGGVA
jgi:hypothetical protein